MIRTKSLENVIYHQKYKEIYKLIFNADIDTISDYSYWMKNGEKDYVEINRPLWIVMESKKANKRIWICHDFGQLSITTAQLDLDINSSAYHDSYKYYYFKNQRDLVDELKKIIEPCLVKDQEKEEELELC